MTRVQTKSEPQKVIFFLNFFDYNYIIFTLANSPVNTWNSWDDRSFGVESKIEEYRRKKVEMISQPSADKSSAAESVEPDFFNEMQPKLKAPKKVPSSFSN